MNNTELSGHRSNHTLSELPKSCSKESPLAPHASRSQWSRNRPPRKRSAFSLIEVAVALGIVSFALVGLIGVLPVALDRYREAGEYSITSDIMRTLVSELEWAATSDLPTNLDPRYFTVDGIEVDQADRAAYVTEISVGSNTDLFGNVVTELKPVTVRVYRLPLGVAAEVEPAAILTVFHAL